MNKVEKPLNNIKQNKFIISEHYQPFKVLGKKRLKENNGKEKFEKNNNNKTFSVLFNLTKENINKENISQDLNNLYDIKKNSCFEYIQPENIKYKNNQFIPTISFL